MQHISVSDHCNEYEHTWRTGGQDEEAIIICFHLSHTLVEPKHLTDLEILFSLLFRGTGAFHHIIAARAPSIGRVLLLMEGGGALRYVS